MMQRYDIINHVIKTFGYKTYLEIGVASGGTFRAVQCESKDGVDSEKTSPEVNYHMTSDEFFKLHSDKTYDIIFIDGMHESEYVCRDLNNSLVALNDGGTIVIHDCFPMSSDISAKRDIWRNENGLGTWCGDGFKVIHAVVENHFNDLDCHVFNVDHGVGVVRRKHMNLIVVSYDENYSWKEMFSNPEKTINLISPDKLSEVV